MDRHTIGSSATPSEPIRWLNARGYDAESYGCDGYGRPGRQGVVFARDLDDPDEQPRFAILGDTLVWDGDRVTVERP